MSYTELFGERAYPLGSIAPASLNGEGNSGRVLVANYHRVAVVLHVGTIGAGETVDLQIEQADAATCGTLKDITGKAITQLVNADDGAICVVEVRGEELDVDGGFEYINAEVTTSAAIILSCIVYGIDPRFEPVPTTNWQEIISA